MYTEERSLNNETMALVADTTAQSSLAFAETTRVNKPTLQIGSSRSSCHGTTTASISWGILLRPMDGIFTVPSSKRRQRLSTPRLFKRRWDCGFYNLGSTILWCACWNMPIVMKGSSGNAVKIVQNVLKINGYYFGSIDGFFGTMTDVAVRQLQISKALPQDGIVGYRTWHALSKLPH